MIPLQAVTLVSSGGTPSQLADQRGAPYPTTGFGALVFNTGPHLIDAVLENALLGGPLKLLAGDFFNPAIQFTTDVIRTPGFYSTGTGNISLVGTSGTEASRVQLASFDHPGNLTVPQYVVANGVLPGSESSTKLATTAWVQSLLGGGGALAPIDSPIFTGDPQVPTPPVGDDDKTIPNTEWVNDAIAVATTGPAGGDLTGNYPDPLIRPGTNGQILTTVGGVADWAAAPVSGVTSVSVVTANGLAGTVATPTTTPAITLRTTVNGMLKGNGTAISAAISGTDYMSPGDVSGAYQPLDAGLTSLSSVVPGIITSIATDTFVARTITGTTSRIAITSGNGVVSNPIIDIDATYAGQSTITSLGTVASGAWNASIIAGQYGGTGIANTGKTVTLGGNLTTTGAFASTFAMTNTTSVTFPTTGTLATTTQLANYLPLTGGTLTGPGNLTVNGIFTVGAAGSSAVPLRAAADNTANIASTAWVRNLFATRGLGAAVYKYNTSANTSVDPGVGKVAIEATVIVPPDPNSRRFAVSKTDDDGVNRYLMLFLPGDSIILTDEIAPIDFYSRYDITSDPIDMGAWVQFNAVFINSQGISPPANSRVKITGYLNTATGDGPILGVAAGAGLLGGGTSGNVQLDVNFNTVAALNSPAFSGNPTAPTPPTSDNDLSIATTQFVKDQGYLTSATAGTSYQPLDTDLTAIANLSTTGLIIRTGAGTMATRSVTGAANRITVTNGDGVTTNAVIDIAATYVGQTSINTLGNVTAGTWQGSLVAGQYGGTGVANTGKTLTLGGNLATTGAFASTFNMTGPTSVTFPTSGTLATTAQLTPGTVTDVSVVSANGLAGTVATSTTTPAITLSTTVNGLLKGDGTSISAAAAGTDYVPPSTLNSYLPLAGGTLTGQLNSTTSLTGASQPALNVQQTWNNAATVFSAFEVNATDTASNASSVLLALRIGGASRVLVTKSGTISSVSHIAAGSASQLYWTSRSVMSSPVDGQILLRNQAVTDFDRLQFGGTTTAFPAIKKLTGPGIAIRDATDVADADVTFKTQTAGTNNTTGATTAFVNTAVAAVIGGATPAGPAGGDLSGTYPNPLLKPAGTNGQIMTTVGGVAQWATATAGGSVTSVSVASANGLAGTVATATTTPAITLSTTVTGMLKGNGTAISAGVAGTDYMSPSDVSGAYLPLTGGVLSGNLSIGSAAAGTSLRVSKAMTGATSAYGTLQMGVAQSDVTNAAVYHGTSAGTQATAFTLPALYHYYASQGTIGAGSVVTGQYGYYVHGSLTGATNNYAFYSNITAGTGRWNLYMNGSADNYVAGALGIGTASVTGYGLYVSKAITGALAGYGIRSNPTFQSDVTSSGTSYYSSINTQAAAFTLGAAFGYRAEQGTIGAGSTVTNQYGFYAGSTLIGATNNFGVYSTIAAGTGRWNFYGAGTAPNLFNGYTTLAGGGASTTMAPGTSTTDIATTAFVQAGLTAQAATFQPLDATLTAVAGLDAVVGLVEQTGSDAFTKRAIGVTTATDVLTRADGDGRYVTPAQALAAYQPLDQDLTALAALSTTGMMARTAANIYNMRAITGTTNRISVTQGDGVAGNPTINIDAAYAGQNTITTLGTVSAGTWNGSVITGQYGGTGVSNTGKTITLGGNLSTTGAFASTFAMTNTTSVVFPTTGTLATTTDLANYLPLTGGTLTGNTTVGVGGLFTITASATPQVTTRSSVPKMAGTDNSSNIASTAWVRDLFATRGQGAAVYKYITPADTTANPGTGNVGIETVTVVPADPNARRIAISKTDDDAVARYLMLFLPGDSLIITSELTPISFYARYDITGNPVDNTTWVQMAAVFIGSQGVAPPSGTRVKITGYLNTATGDGPILGVAAGDGLLGGGVSGNVELDVNFAVVAALDSPVFTGNPTAPTPVAGDNDTSIATTKFVKDQGYLTTAAANAAYQPIDADLTALAGLNATAGLVEQTGAAAFTKRLIGTAGGTSIPTLADADARYLSVATAATTYQPLDSDLTAIAGLATTGILIRTGAGTVATRSVTGAANRITVTNGDGVTTNATIDIAATYVGQTSITTLGTVAAGTWNASVIPGLYGGTGVANSGKTITIGGNLTTAGAFASTFTMTGTTNVTFPTTGTLATTADIAAGAYLPLAGGTLTGPLLGTTATFSGAMVGATFQTSRVGNTIGGVGFTAGDATHMGYVNFNNAAGTRQGYIGYSQPIIGYAAEVTGGYHNFTCLDGPSRFTLGNNRISINSPDTLQNAVILMTNSAQYYYGTAAVTYFGASNVSLVSLQTPYMLPITTKTTALGATGSVWNGLHTVNVVFYGATSGTITVNPPAVAGANTITWPAATGTVALTTDIPVVAGNYLPISGGTLTGPLTGTTATFFAPITDGTVVLSGFFGSTLSTVVGSGSRIYLGAGGSTSRGTYIDGVNTGGSNNAHDLVFSTSASAAAPAERMRISNNGTVTFKGPAGTGSGTLNHNDTALTLLNVSGTTLNLGGSNATAVFIQSSGFYPQTTKTKILGNASFVWNALHNVSSVFYGATSGTATVTAPAVTGTTALTLPASSGTLALTTDAAIATVSATAPSSPIAGQLWFNSDGSTGGGRLYLYYNDGNTSQWVPVSGA